MIATTVHFVESGTDVGTPRGGLVTNEVQAEGRLLLVEKVQSVPSFILSLKACIDSMGQMPCVHNNTAQGHDTQEVRRVFAL